MLLSEMFLFLFAGFPEREICNSALDRFKEDVCIHYYICCLLLEHCIDLIVVRHLPQNAGDLGIYCSRFEPYQSFESWML